MIIVISPGFGVVTYQIKSGEKSRIDFQVFRNRSGFVVVATDRIGSSKNSSSSWQGANQTCIQLEQF